MLTDNDLFAMRSAIREAFKARIMGKIEVYIVAVGELVEDEDLCAMASPPADVHVIRVANYEDLADVVLPLRNALC